MVPRVCLWFCCCCDVSLTSSVAVDLSRKDGRLLQTFSPTSTDKEASIGQVSCPVAWTVLPHSKLWVRVIGPTFHKKTASACSQPLWLRVDGVFPFQREAATSASSPGALGKISGHVSGDPLRT